MVVDGEGDAARERVPVPVDVHHHRRVHQTVFLPYGALHRRRKSEYRGTGGHQPVQAHDEGSQVGVFRADLSFLGWWLLNLFTLGLSGIFYSNGYNAAFFVEYYVHVRGLSKDSGLEGSELLSDEYLYSKASAETLHAAYGDVAETVEQLSSNLVPVDKPNGFVGFLSEWLGVRILHARSVTKYEEYREQLHQIDTGREILDGAIYPGRLAPAPMAFRFRESRTVSSDRSYSLVNLVMMFLHLLFRGMGMGGEPRLHFRRNVRESWHAAWAMAADLWHRRSDYP